MTRRELLRNRGLLGVLARDAVSLTGTHRSIFLLRTPRALRTKMWSVIIAATSVLAPVAIAGAGPVMEAEGSFP